MDNYAGANCCADSGVLYTASDSSVIICNGQFTNNTIMYNYFVCGILNSKHDVSIFINHSTFVNNTSPRLRSNNNDSDHNMVMSTFTMSINNSQFINNHGGVIVHIDMIQYVVLIISHSRFINNSGTDSLKGSDIDYHNIVGRTGDRRTITSITITHTMFSNNVYGGFFCINGLYHEHFSLKARATVTIIRSQFFNNKAGILDVESEDYSETPKVSTVTISDSDFIDNTDEYNGVVLKLTLRGSAYHGNNIMNITHSRFIGNSCGGQGILYTMALDSVISIHISHCHFQNNSAHS